MFDDLPADSQVPESNQPQDETNQAPVTDDEPAKEVEEQVDEPETEDEPKRPAERTVPVSALIEERRRYQSRIAEVRRELDALKRGADRQRREADDDTEEGRLRRAWTKQLGIDQLREQLEDLSGAMEDIMGRVGKVDDLSHGANLAVRSYIGGVEQHALSQYEDSLPINKNQFERLVASEITQEEAAEIFRGNHRAIDGAVKRVKQAFRRANPAAARKAAEAAKVNRLPKAPASGGTAPRVTDTPKPFTSMRDLHNDAWEDFQNVRNRQQE